MKFSSFFIPYIPHSYKKSDLIDIIENTYQIGEIKEINIIISKKGNYMAFIHMASVYITEKNNKILSIIDEQGQYYLYDIKNRCNLIIKRMIRKSEPYHKEYCNIEKKLEDINTKINHKFICVYTEFENIKQIIYDIQRKIYGYTIPTSHISNECDNWS
jgi:hypothetical protein